MTNKKKFCPTNAMQNVAVDILNQLEVLLMQTKGDVKSDKLWSVIKDVSDKYMLETDPFTQMVCSSKEYETNTTEYNKQVMMQLYGHCDGM